MYAKRHSKSGVYTVEVEVDYIAKPIACVQAGTGQLSSPLYYTSARSVYIIVKCFENEQDAKYIKNVTVSVQWCVYFTENSVGVKTLIIHTYT